MKEREEISLEEEEVEVKEEPDSDDEDEEMEDDGSEESDSKEDVKKVTITGGKYVKAKEPKPGIVYLSKIPPKMNVKQVREYFTTFGELNRSFLQPEKKHWTKGKRKTKNQTFTEGWIEFKKKRHAKRVAEVLNNQPVGGKKRKEYHDFLWNIKYLRGFLWVHLNERLAYERISQQHKVRAEISAAKRETAFFAKNVELSRKLKKKGLLSKVDSTS